MSQASSIVGVLIAAAALVAARSVYVCFPVWFPRSHRADPGGSMARWMLAGQVLGVVALALGWWRVEIEAQPTAAALQELETFHALLMTTAAAAALSTIVLLVFERLDFDE